MSQKNYKDDSWRTQYFTDDYLEIEHAPISKSTTKEDVDFIESIVKLEKKQLVLDLGCGPGRHLLELGARGFENLYGLDDQTKFLEIANKSLNDAGIKATLICNDMRTYKTNVKFDLIYSFYNSLFYWDDNVHLNLLSNLHSMLNKHGKIVIDLPNFDNVIGRYYVFNISFIKTLRHLRFQLLKILNKLFNFEFSYNLSDLDLINGYFNGEYLYFRRNRTLKILKIRTKIYTIRELTALITNAGFEIESFYGSTSAEPHSLFKDRTIIVLNKKN